MIYKVCICGHKKVSHGTRKKGFDKDMCLFCWQDFCKGGQKGDLLSLHSFKQDNLKYIEQKYETTS